MNNYVKQWLFSENGNAYDLTKISCVNRYDTKPKTEYVVVMDNKQNLLISEDEAREILKALKEREVAIERIVNTNEGEKTVHTLYDGTKAAFTKCWEDNEGFIHHIDGCSYECGKGHPS